MTMHLVRRSAKSVPWVDKETLTPIGKQDSTGHDVGPRTSKSSSPSEEPGSMILRGYCEARRFQRLRPIPFQAQGPRQGGRSARGRMKGIQTARIYCRGRPCPRQAKTTREEGTTSPEAISLGIPKEIPSPIGQPQEHGRKATLGKAVTSVLTTHS